LNNITTIIFDLGGVIIDLDVSRTINRFSALSGFPTEKVKELYKTQPVFHELEKGLITDEDFRQAVRSLFNADSVSDISIDDAWNAMLLSIPLQRLNLLRKLKDRYRVMILSNTNCIHVRDIHDRILPAIAGVTSFDSFVHKVYYSCDLKMRKPDSEIYQFVLDDYNLRPGETIFLDDNTDNVMGAERLGINVKHIPDANVLYELFD
jgi:putative hydrolase of the HAD superfamily